MVAALQNMDAAAFDFIDETVRFVDGATVPCREVASQIKDLLTSFRLLAMLAFFSALRRKNTKTRGIILTSIFLVLFESRWFVFFVLRLPVHVIVPASADECNVAHLAIASSSSMVFVT